MLEEKSTKSSLRRDDSVDEETYIMYLLYHKMSVVRIEDFNVF